MKIGKQSRMNLKVILASMIVLVMTVVGLSFSLKAEDYVQTSIVYDFRDLDFAGKADTEPWNTRPSQPGWRLIGLPTDRPVMGIQNYGVSIGTTDLEQQRLFEFHVPEDGHYLISFEALTYSAGGISELLIDDQSIGTYNFYSPAQAKVTKPISYMHLTEGTHTLTLRVVGKDPDAPAPPAAEYRTTALLLILEKQETPPEIEDITLTMDTSDLYIGAQEKLRVTGKTAEGISVNVNESDLSYHSDHTDVAVVNEDGIVTIVGGGEASITVSATLNGVTKTDTLLIDITTFVYDFRNLDFPGKAETESWNTRPNQPGWHLVGLPSDRPVMGIQNYGVSIGTNEIGQHRSFEFNVADDAYYLINFEALTYSAGGISELLIDDQSIGTYNFYSPTQAKVTQPLSIMYLTEGTHTLTLRVVGKDPDAADAPAPRYRTTASLFILEKQETPPEVEDITLTVDSSNLYVGAQEKLRVFGKTAEGMSVNLNESDLSYNSDNADVAVVNEDGMVTIVGAGEASITVSATLNGVTKTDTIMINISTIVYDFRDLDFPGKSQTEPWSTRPSVPGWRLVGLPTERPVMGLQNYGVSIATNRVGQYRSFEFNVADDGYYLVTFDALKYSRGGVGELFIDDQSIGTFDFYSEAQAKASKPLYVLKLTKGSHLLTLQVIAHDSRQQTTATSLTLEKLDQLFETMELALTVEQPELFVGYGTKLHVKGETPEGIEIDLSHLEFEFSSLSESIASINEHNEVVGIQSGMATLHVDVIADEVTRSATLDIPVVEPILDDIEASLYQTDLFIGDHYTVDVSGYLSSGELIELSGADFEYETNHPDVAIVDETGKVRAVGVGEAEITVTATLDGVTQTDTIDITTQEVTHVKTRSTIYTPEKVAAARENVENYDWADAQKDAAVAEADTYLALGYDFLWHLITPQSIPRSYAVSREGGSPITGQEVYDHGVYPWIGDPIENPWKIEDPSSGYLFPTNDFQAYYESGLNTRGIFDPELADRSLLVNELYPEKGPDWGVDDGHGWIDEEGNKFMFIAYYNHWLNWGYNMGVARHGRIPKALNAFRDAYTYTGDIRYARAGIAMLDRIADVYPDMELDSYKHEAGYLNATGETGKGKILGSEWETLLINYFLRAYDAFYPAIDDPVIIDFLSDKAEQYDLSVLKKSAAGIRRNIEDGIVRQVFPAVKKVEIRGNTGTHQASLALAAVVLDHLPETKEWLDFTFQAGNFTRTPPEITGGDVLGTLVYNFDRDGGGYHSSPGYNALIADMYVDIADILAGYDLYPSADLYEHVKIKKLFDSFWPLILSDGFVPNIGDFGNTGNKSTLLTLERKIKAFKMYGDPIYAQLVYYLNGNNTTGIHGDIFSEDAGLLADEIEAVIAEHGPLNLQGTHLTGYGFAALRDRAADQDIYDVSTERDLWMFYGPQAAHGHADTLNIGLHAFGLDLLPEIGYPQTGGLGTQQKEWVKNTISHNTVIVDKSTQIHAGAQPKHFDHGQMVKLIDVAAPKDYPQTDMYRRTTSMIRVDEENSYAVDFFHVKGGDDHHFSFHSAEGTVTTEGLDLTEQLTGTYAGVDVEYAEFPDEYTSSGFQFLKNVSRDEDPSDHFSVDWNVKDTWNYYGNGVHADTDVHLRLTMMGQIDEVALADGVPSQNRPGNPESLRYLVAHRSGEDLNSVFTSVIEPYKGERFIESIELVPVKSAGEIVNEDVRAVKVTLSNGRIDYIVNALNSDVLYTIDDTFEFQGFFGVYSEKDGQQVLGYIHDGYRIGEIETSTAALSGTVLDFTKEMSFENELTVEMNQAYDNLDEWVGRFIYIENDGERNASYKIEGIKAQDGNKVTLSTGDITYAREWKDKFDFSQGYIYDVTEGASFTIPLSVEKDVTPLTLSLMLDKLNDLRQEIATDLSYRQLEIHLTSIAQFEQQEETAKVIKHMESFHLLLDHQKDHDLISEKAYNTLQSATNSLIQQWK